MQTCVQGVRGLSMRTNERRRGVTGLRPIWLSGVAFVALAGFLAAPAGAVPMSAVGGAGTAGTTGATGGNGGSGAPVAVNNDVPDTVSTTLAIGGDGGQGGDGTSGN